MADIKIWPPKNDLGNYANRLNFGTSVLWLFPNPHLVTSPSPCGSTASIFVRSVTNRREGGRSASSRSATRATNSIFLCFVSVHLCWESVREKIYVDQNLNTHEPLVSVGRPPPFIFCRSVCHCQCYYCGAVFFPLLLIFFLFPFWWELAPSSGRLRRRSVLKNTRSTRLFLSGKNRGTAPNFAACFFLFVFRMVRRNAVKIIFSAGDVFNLN